MNPGAIGSPDPSGIAYLNAGSRAGHLLISDGEVDEMDWLFGNQNVNAFETTLTGELLVSSNTISYSDEPTGVAFNPLNLHVFISDDIKRRIFEVAPGTDGVFGTADDTVVGAINTRDFNSTDPEGVAYDPTEGALYIADGLNAEVYKVRPGPNGRFNGAPPSGDDIVTSFDTLSLGIDDPEGIEWDPATGNLYISGKPATRVVEATTSGALVRLIDISAARARFPAGLALGPWCGVGFDPHPGVLNLYIVDRGVDNNNDPNENDGKLYEISFPGTPSGGGTQENQRPNLSAGADQIVPFTASCSGSTDRPCTTLNGIVNDDGLPNPPAQVTISWSQVSGPGAVVFGNQNTAQTTANFSAEGVYVLRLTADDSELTNSDEVQITVLPPPPPLTSIYVSLSAKSGTVRGIPFGREDILRYDIDTDTWSLYFDGSNVGLGTSGVNLNGFHILADGSILFVMQEAATLPNVGFVDNADIIRFIPTSLGQNNTAGTFELYFKGANVGLGPSSQVGGEKIDAISFLPDGRLLVSTSGNFSVPGVSGSDEDLIAFTATSLGATTSGTWELYFDGSDVGLSDGGSSEDVEGVSVNSNGDIYLTTNSNFSVPGVSGDGADIFRCQPQSTGSTTNCTYDLVWSGSAYGLAGYSLDGIDLVHGTAGNSAPTVTISAPANNATFTVGDTVTFTGTASDTEDGNLTGSLTWISSLNGALGNGGTVNTSSLSVGTHVITASVTDSGGSAGSRSISVIVGTTPTQNTAPGVTINSPANNATFTQGQSITFTGTASDTEDGNLTGSLAWISSLNGALGNGGTVNTSSLSVGTHVITASVTDSGGLAGSHSISVTIVSQSSGSASIYVTTSTKSGSVGNISFGREDILRYDIATDSWSLYFDGSSVGLGSADVNGFHLMADGSILFTIRDAATLPDVGFVDNADIIRFIPTNLGQNNTAGVFELYFKGANVGLGPSSQVGGEKIDALSFLPDGRLLVSISGSFSVPGVSGSQEDLIVFTATSLGETTSGSWKLYFDGSSVELSGEDVDGASVDSTGNIYLTTKGNFSVPGISGNGADIFRCTPQSVVPIVSCNYALFWRGSEHGLAGHDINGMHVILP
jgi:hypothetical protein